MTDGVPIDGKQDAYEVIHMVVALGNIYNYQKANSSLKDIVYSEIPPMPSALPEGFNSLRVSKNNEYVVFNSNQVSVLHLVRFKGGENLAHEPTPNHICKICGEDNATIYCENDHCKLCAQCDAQSHAEGLMAEHTRLPLEDALIDIQDCPIHPGNHVKYFCPKCHLPICLECKIKDTHARGEAAKHRLVDLRTAYADATATMKRPDTIMTNREKAIADQLKAADAKLAEVEANGAALEAEINRIAQKAIAEARQQTAELANRVKSKKAELLRKQSELRQQQALMKTHASASEPVPFLAAYYRSLALERDFADNKDLPGRPDEIQADLTVYGRLQVGPPAARQSVRERAVHASGTGTNTGTYSYTEEDKTESSIYNEQTEPHITSLERMAKRKEQKLGRPLSFAPFEGSEILESPDDARMLYLCLPFKGTPETHLMFSSARDGRSISKMHKLIDGMGITVVLVRANGQVFGGFAASKWNKDGVPFGKNSSSFLFSVSKDGFIPFRPQSDEPICLYATKDSLTFGKYDLCLAGDFDRCYSTIENSFGVGFPFDSPRARSYLAEERDFKAEIVEVWGFFSGK